MSHDILKLFLNIGSIGGFFGILGAIYLYFENKRFRKIEAERDYILAKTDLIEINEKIKQEESALDQHIHDVIRGSKTRDIFEMNRPGLQKLEIKKAQVPMKYVLPKSRIEANIKYYKKLKNHSIFWFLKREKSSELWNPLED